MNIFVLDSDPILAARYQCNKHVVKMILETAQMLCSPFDPGTAPYKRSHFNHPCSVWVRQSRTNFDWLVTHGLALCAEYETRYGKTHKSKAVIEWCSAQADQLSFPSIGLTSFAQAMPEECQNADPVTAYRTYYRTHKKEIAQWPEGKIPFWY